MLELKLIDGVEISIIPVILGDGVRLFENSKIIKKLQLISTERFGEMVELNYELKNREE